MKYVFKALGEFTVEADSLEEAKEQAREWVDRTLDSATVAYRRKDWKPEAARLIEAGMSHGEVAEAVGVHRSTISHAFPGTGMSKQLANEIRDLRSQVNDYQRRLGAGR